MAEEDLARSRYRLALILHELGRQKEALTLEKQATEALVDEGIPQDSTKEAIIEMLDRRVYVENGRSTGPFRGLRSGKS